jgi:methylated-DNA-protein-cysteine methyltransferase-like protein
MQEVAPIPEWQERPVKFFAQVYALVRHIPAGHVATYGQIARLLDHPHAARTVGWALKSTPAGSGIPWHRVVNAAGRISLSSAKGKAEQRRRLEAEGVIFEPDHHIDLARFGWIGLPREKVRDLTDCA